MAANPVAQALQARLGEVMQAASPDHTHPDIPKGAPDVTTGSQLPQGEATQLNAEMVQSREQQDKGSGAPAEPLPETAPRPYQAPQAGGDSLKDFLTAPAPGTPDVVQPAPDRVGEWLPALKQAAEDPQAPADFKQMMQLVTYHLSQES